MNVVVGPSKTDPVIVNLDKKKSKYRICFCFILIYKLIVRGKNLRNRIENMRAIEFIFLLPFAS